MNTRPGLLSIVFAIAFLPHSGGAQLSSHYQYVFPKPNSRYVSRESNIIIRPGPTIDPASMQTVKLFDVSGSKSGKREGLIVLADDQKTILFNPLSPFAEEERVTVTIAEGLRSIDGYHVSGWGFEFTTSMTPSLLSSGEETGTKAGGEAILSLKQGLIAVAGDTLPADFPPIRVDTVNNPAPGEIFLGGFGGIGGTLAYANYLVIADNSGKALAYKRIGTSVNPFAYMFKTDPNGLYSYIDRTPTATNIRIVDSTFTQVDTYPRGNPTTASHADFLLLPNGHALVLYFDIKTIDMSRIVTGGHPAANVTGCLIQEFDLNKNVVFQWSGFDELPITDTYEDTLAASFAYSHANGVALDNDGNVLVSLRHMSQIVKIDRNTGEVVWRLGGKRNEFTFINEHPENSPLYFSYPHHIQRLPNGNIIMFDNGNQRSTKYSRVVEYRLDEVNKTATLVWEYRHTPDIYASAQGSVQRLPNGNTLIGWGDASLQGKPAVTEVHPDNSLAFELFLPQGYRSMRVYRLPWKPLAPAAAWTLYELLPGNIYAFNDTSAGSRTGARIKFNEMSGTGYNSATVERFSTAPSKPQFSGRSPWTAALRFTVSQFGIASMTADLMFDATQITGIPDPNQVIIYQRDTVGKGSFSPLPTSYNSVRNEIVAPTSRFGEFVFCWVDSDSSASAPGLISPAHGDGLNQKLPIGFSWNPRGTVTGYQLQVASDSLFTTLVLDDSLLTASKDTLKSFTPGAKYFWRVRSRNFGRTSGWSQVRSFTTTLPYITLSSPIQGEVLRRGYSYFIRWTSNIMDRVRIDLLKGATRLLVVKDSVTNVGAYSWSIPSSLSPDSTYGIRITSVADSTVFALSAGTFAISSGATGIDDPDLVPAIFALQQNYPNPFNPRTALSFQLPVISFVKLGIFDVLGREIETLVDEVRAIGTHTVSWDASSRPSGVYFYQIQATIPNGEKGVLFFETKKMVLVR